MEQSPLLIGSLCGLGLLAFFGYKNYYPVAGQERSQRPMPPQADISLRVYTGGNLQTVIINTSRTPLDLAFMVLNRPSSNIGVVCNGRRLTNDQPLCLQNIVDNGVVYIQELQGNSINTENERSYGTLLIGFWGAILIIILSLSFQFPAYFSNLSIILLLVLTAVWTIVAYKHLTIPR